MIVILEQPYARPSAILLPEAPEWCAFHKSLHNNRQAYITMGIFVIKTPALALDSTFGAVPRPSRAAACKLVQPISFATA